MKTRETLEIMMIYLKETKEDLIKFETLIRFLASKIGTFESCIKLLDERIKKNEEYLEIERIKRMYWRS